MWSIVGSIVKVSPLGLHMGLQNKDTHPGMTDQEKIEEVCLLGKAGNPEGKSH